MIQIAKIGVPAGAQGMIFSISNVCILAAINGFGSKASAGSAAALNFENFMFYIVNAFSQAAVTFTSQNYGAKKYDRCKKVFRICICFALVFCALMCMSFVAGREFFIRIYTTDPVVMKYGLMRMTHVLTLGFLISTYEVTGNTLRGIGYSVLPTVIILMGVCGFRMVWIYTVFQKYKSFSVLMTAYPITWVITGTIMLTVYFIISRKKLTEI